MRNIWHRVLAMGLLLAAALIGGCSAPEAVALNTGQSTFTDKQILKKAQYYCTLYGMSESELREDSEMWNKLLDDIVYDYAFVDMALDEAKTLDLAIPDGNAAEVQQVYTRLMQELETVVSAEAGKELAGEALTKATDEYRKELGFTKETFLTYAQKKVVQELVKQEWSQGDEVSERKVRDQYAYALQSQKKYMDIDPAYAIDLIQKEAQTIVYYPQGLRYIRTVTVPFAAETRGKASILYSEGKMREYNALMEEAEAAILPQIEEVRAQIQEGVPFAELAAQTEMDTVENENGQLVWEGDEEMLTAFQTALKQLKNVGDIAECNTYLGHQFIQYSAVAPMGEVPFEEVSEALKKEVLSTKRVLEYDETMRNRLREKTEKGDFVLDLSRLRIEEGKNG